MPLLASLWVLWTPVYENLVRTLLVADGMILYYKKFLCIFIFFINREFASGLYNKIAQLIEGNINTEASYRVFVSFLYNYFFVNKVRCE